MVLEYRPQWNPGGANPGFTVLHGRIQGGSTGGVAAQQFADRVRTFFNALVGFLPNEVVINFPGEVLELDTATGVLTDVHTITPPATVTGTSTSVFAWASGVRVEWRTPAIVSGKRLRGRTFIVPAGSNVFDLDGTLTGSAITSLNAAAAAYINTSVFTNAAPGIWSRTHGILADITSFLVPDEGAVMRSRRD